MTILPAAPTIGHALNFLSRFESACLFPVKRLAKFPPLVRRNLAEASNDERQLNAWHDRWPGCNWAVALNKSGIIAVDVDCKGGKSGRLTWDVLDVLDGWPRTARSQTPSGGWHDYYIGPHTFALGKSGFGADVDSPNYVIIPGSSLPAGEYKWINNHGAVPAAEWMLGMLRRKQTETLIDDISKAVIEADQPGNIKWCIDYLEREAPPSIEGQRGEFTLLKIAMSLRDMGISFETAVALIFEHYNIPEHCDPLWDMGELTTKVRNGYTYANKRRMGEASALFEFATDDFDPASIQISKPRRRIDKRRLAASKRATALNRR